MNNEMRLARVDLGPGWIDMGYGEPVIVQEIFHKYMNPLVMPRGDTLSQSKYQPPQGNKEFVALLEAKYGARVVVTNGAKHGMAAVSHAIKKIGHSSMMIHSPYWVSTPTIIASADLNVQVLNETVDADATAFMLTSPNNPDGKELTKQQLEEATAEAKASNILLVHDAAYYTPIYMQNPETTKVGDVQIYSFSKMWGLSGLRLGYVVVHNEALLPGIVEYVEQSCSGVSTASQHIGYAIEKYFIDNPADKEAFEKEARDSIAASRAELANLRPEVLMPEPCASNSMFAWCKVGPELDNERAKVNLIHGDLFGKPGMVRLNIAMKPDLIKTAIERLNGSEAV